MKKGKSMKKFDFTLEQLLTQEQIEHDYIVLNSRMVIGCYIEKILKSFKEALKREDIFTAKKNIKKLSKFSFCNKLSLKSILNLLKPGNEAYLMETTNLKMLTGSDLYDVFYQIKALAKKKYPKAICRYLYISRKPDEDIVSFVKEIEKKENKTPEEYEMCAALHYRDTLSLFGENYEHVHNVQDLINETLKKYKEIKENETSKKLLTDQEYEKHETAYFTYEYLIGRLKNTDYGKNIINAQVGYAQRIATDNYLYIDDINNLLEVTSGENKIFVDDYLMMQILYYERDLNEYMLKTLNDDYKALIKRKDYDMSVYYWHKIWKVYNSRNDAQEEKAIIALNQVAEQKLFLPLQNKILKQEDKSL